MSTSGNYNQNSVGQLSTAAINDSLVESTIEFIWSSLIPWKNDPSRPFAEGEEDLNAQFHNFLEARARREFSMVFFQPEQRQKGRRRVDLSAKPVINTIIRGVTFSIYEPIIVIECKRLPAPSKAREREYVAGEPDVSGGIQRFKLGLHGKEHETVIIIGYVQSKSLRHWFEEINKWILHLSENTPYAWNPSESLTDFRVTNTKESSRSWSTHPRVNGCSTESVAIEHFWIDVN